MKILIKLVIMAMVAVVPYTVPAFIQPAVAEVCVGGSDIVCTTDVILPPVPDPNIEDACDTCGNSCVNKPDKEGCTPPPPPACNPSCLSG